MGPAMYFFMLVFISMESRMEQRAAIKASARSGDSVCKTIERLQAAWTDHALSIPQIRFWYKRFLEDPDRNTKDCKHPGQPKSKRNDQNKDLVEEQLQAEKRSTLRQVAETCQMSKTTVHRIVRSDLKMRKLALKFVPKVLTPAQMQTRLQLCRDNVRTLEADPGILSRIIATDESWIFTYDPRTKHADMEWTRPGEPRPSKALRSRSQRRTMLILFFDSHGPIHCFFNDEGTVDNDIYIESVRQMREQLRCKRPQLWADKNFYLLQDNASPHTSVDTLAYFFTVDLAEWLWPHPQYSLDLSPCDYWVFPLLKAKIRGHRFQNIQDVQTSVRRTLRDLPVVDYQDCFDKLLLRYRRCIEAGGQYFEGQGSRGLGPIH